MKRELAAGLIIKDGRMLLLKNIKDGHLRVEPPGGKVRRAESYVEALKREVLEELGVEAGNFRFFALHSTLSPEGEFPVHMYFCDILAGEPRCMEPEKFSGFAWYAFPELKRLMADGVLVENMAAALPGLKRFFVEGG
ncbi:MAG: NUDIX domain-containing protein [Thermodesulfobacteriota bacterium]